MRRILKFLATSVLVLPVATSTVACNQKPPSSDPGTKIDFDGTLNLITNVIKKHMVAEINKGNLITETSFQGTEWTNIKDSLSKSQIDKPITNIKPLTDNLNNNLDTIINDSINEILKNNFLSGFFHGIDTKDILKLDTENTQYSKQKFDWNELKDALPTDSQKKLQQITFWDKLSSAIKIKMDYIDNDGNKQEYVINETYDYQVFDSKEPVRDIIDLVSKNFSNKLKGFHPQIDLANKRYDYQTQTNEYTNLLKTSVMEKLNKDLGVNIAESLAWDLSSHEGYDNSALFGRNISGFLSYDTYKYLMMDKKNFYNSFLDYSKKQEISYTDNLIQWLKKEGIKDLKNTNQIMLYGEYQITNWSYKGLTLNPINIDYTVIQNDTRQAQMESSAKFLSNMFSINGILKDKIKDEDNGHKFTMALSKNKFEELKTKNKTVDDAITAEQQEIIKVGKDNGMLNDNDKFIFDTHYFGGSSDANIHNLKINEHLQKNNTFYYIAPPSNLYMICAFNNIYINFSATNGAGCINNFYITESNN